MACCNDYICGITSGERRKQGAAHNECVKIQRKLYDAGVADDCCSTCSHCSNCSCQNADATSCSSIDDLDADDNDEEGRMAPHELVVSAECHRCYLRRRSTISTGEEAEEEAQTDDKLTAASIGKQVAQEKEKTTTESSTHTSRRSSASFCSCHSSTCCCCECDCADEAGDDDCETATTGQMHTARDTSCRALTSAADFDAEHSSNLTPLTNASSVASTPNAEDADVTLRSFNNTLTEDIGSSLSQSAEYFSLSSGNHQSQKSPTETPTRRKLKIPGEINPAESVSKSTNVPASSRKPCKHYIKHHRHKRDTSPLDSYL
ncbi:uncharacterized protein LOC118740945 isoform X3 [Rhagoletis pomonella]|uniref:uncharacterized protein LOC118740945 isoform X3 n=1 Tax=Rhagoletis pomonella TaxID=28610 RepID=UPI001786B086|nr:uncharacterized protein LOC118740945 isoform X3 [Rhagoletis pomonella]